ncbi:MAG: c-type cytochrome [Planctomycetaceae bacterium]|nr:c-type cytochrome [Planctomycetaceae bacterium]
MTRLNHSHTVISFALLGLFGISKEANAGETFTQPPTIAPAQLRDAAEAKPETPTPDRASLAQGPPATWIWGPDANQQYVLTREFDGGAKIAWLKASSDNSMTLFVNGQRVTSSDEWQTPVEVDIQEYLQPGKNVLRAEVANAGGIAAFACKLALTMPDGTVRYVVSDESWNAVEKSKLDQQVALKTFGKMGVSPWGDVFSKPAGLVARDRDVFNVPAGFQVELLYTVPKETLGSWVSITFDNKGRLLASDQGDKGICRITPPAIGSSEPTKVEHLDVKLTSAHGMLYAFDSLYLSINGGPGSGLYRARDTNGDDQYDEVVKLKEIRGGGEHGPHALRLSPDGKSIYLIAGNHTDPPADFDASAVPKNWGEDLLLPRQWDARGHARGKLAPGGWIAKSDPDGKTWEIVSAGYRNPYDMDFNADGELFAYDADMEWDMGTPWYRPTRVVHATSGSEFGWRSGTGKWPSYYIDSLPELVDIGPGSPVGVTFGYGTKFPPRFQKALFICDWTFGTMYAIHSEADGASYTATKEEFLSRTPLPLTDNAVGPDGALYFTVGGRGAQSELFRVTYVGDELTAPADTSNTQGSALFYARLRKLRQQLEQYHRPAPSPQEAIDFAWKHLWNRDRHIRYAARIAIEHQDVSLWQERALQERQPQSLITAAVALARQGDPSLQGRLLQALETLDYGKLGRVDQLDLLRAWSLIFVRMGPPSQDVASGLAKKLDAFYPDSRDAFGNLGLQERMYPHIGDSLNRELCNMLVYLNSPTVATKTMTLIAEPSRESTTEMTDLLARNSGYGGTVAKILSNQVDLQKLHYAFALRNLRYGWTLEQRQQYFNWLAEARTKSGGASYEGFIDNIRSEALANASEAERKAIESSVAIAPPKPAELPKPEGPGHDWQLDELVQATSSGLSGRDFERGKRMFAAARCVICHRFDGSGGATGPDLTNVAGRFSFKDLSEAIVDPSKVVSDQYRASVVVTTSGQVYTGRVAGEQNGTLTVLTDPEDINKVVEVPAEEVDEVTPSRVSLMPKDLLKTLNQDEVLDLFAYLLSRGNPADAMFAD